MFDYTPKQLDRFWSKVAIDYTDFSCWLWMAYRLPEGYGYLLWNGKKRGAHRVAYAIAFGSFPTHLLVCHHCDNPSCVNPNHLFLGTSAENTQDKMQKGRHVPGHGENHSNSKLCDEQVRAIREEYANGGISQRELGKKFNIAHSTLSLIINRKRWQHLD